MQWKDLTHPSYFDNIAMADPNMSGSVTKAFEMLIQQQMHDSLRNAANVPEFSALPDDEKERARKRALSRGWTLGLRIIQDIGANSRYFTDSATKIPHDVAQGEAAENVHRFLRENLQ